MSKVFKIELYKRIVTCVKLLYQILNINFLAVYEQQQIYYTWNMSHAIDDNNHRLKVYT